MKPRQTIGNKEYECENENDIEKLKIGESYDMRGKRFLDANIYKYTDSNSSNNNSNSGSEQQNNFSQSIFSASASFFTFGLLGGNVPQEYSEEGVPTDNRKNNNNGFDVDRNNNTTNNNNNNKNKNKSNSGNNRNSVGPGSFTPEKAKGFKGGVFGGIEKKLSPFSLRINMTGKKSPDDVNWTGIGTGVGGKDFFGRGTSMFHTVHTPQPGFISTENGSGKEDGCSSSSSSSSASGKSRIGDCSNDKNDNCYSNKNNNDSSNNNKSHNNINSNSDHNDDNNSRDQNNGNNNCNNNNNNNNNCNNNDNNNNNNNNNSCGKSKNYYYNYHNNNNSNSNSNSNSNNNSNINNNNNSNNNNINSNSDINSINRNGGTVPAAARLKMYGEILFVNHSSHLLIVTPHKTLQSTYDWG